MARRNDGYVDRCSNGDWIAINGRTLLTLVSNAI